MRRFWGCLLAVWMMLPLISYAEETGIRPGRHVMIISFDGLRPDAITALGPDRAPNFHKAIAEGASTLNARTDPDRTVTMPNHTCMLTGRGVMGKEGHEYIDNRSTDRSLHENKGAYVASIFDVAKSHGLTTGFFASKPKFRVFVNSYAGTSKALQPPKIDIQHVTEYDDEGTLKALLGVMEAGLPDLTFVHFSGPDNAGHKHGWDLSEGSVYWSTVRKEDMILGEIFRAIESNPSLVDSTVLIITSDHGGRGDDHDDVTKMENYRIPFIIWGKGVARKVDLYKINTEIRNDPAENQVPYGIAGQPIRNGDSANCAMSVLGLPLVPGSTIGNPDALRVSDVQ